jgi:hypothetical protein
MLYVLDSASLIRLKRIPVRDQWELFRRLEEMVADGAIAMPRQVIREVSEISHPDVPGVWARGVEPRLVHPLEPDYEILEEVMVQAGDVVEPDDPGDPADPYVLAIALQLQRNGNECMVVSDDVVDRPPLKTSVKTACKRLHLSHCTLEEFLHDIEGPPLPA